MSNGKGDSMTTWKFAAITIPILAAILGWIVLEMITFKSNRFTSRDAYEMEVRWNARFENLPPKETKAQIDKNTTNILETTKILHKLDITLVRLDSRLARMEDHNHAD